MVAVVKGTGPKPKRVRVRMYQVGFGDCFLLTFEYDRRLADGRHERQVLIDLGSTRPPRGPGPKKRILPIAAARLAQDCNGRLDALIVTHRHRDHLGGFGEEEVATIIEGLQPFVVVRPWTEDPALEGNAVAPGEVALVQMLNASQDFALTLRDLIGKPGSNSLAAELQAWSAQQVPNLAAIQRLDGWAAKFGQQYLRAGQDSGLGVILPGVGVTVLGPPTVAEHAGLVSQRTADEEYWMLQKNLLGKVSFDATARAPGGDDESDSDDDGDALDGDPVIGDPALLPPGPIRWLGEKLQRSHLQALKRLVNTVDNALNNTSLILLIQAGNKRLLFPGDAQIENWEFILGQLKTNAALRRALTGVDLYKVGHHGSRNATPRSLLALWTEGAAADRPMVALLSTRAGVHGKRETTAVPRSSLVTALTDRMTVLTTDTPDTPVEVIEVVAPTTTPEPFVRVT